jgi:hypothetical protein
MKAICFAAVCLLMALPVAGCGRAEVGQRVEISPGEVKTILVDNATHVTLTVAPALPAPESVELIYFHTKDPCHCMAVVGDSIKYAVDTYFKDETAAGKVKLTMIVSDDPANADLLKKYDAMYFSLFVREIRPGAEKIYPVNAIWEMTGDDNRDKLVDFIKNMLTEILAGKNV